jgi:hypothetical protein
MRAVVCTNAEFDVIGYTPLEFRDILHNGPASAVSWFRGLGERTPTGAATVPACGWRPGM